MSAVESIERHPDVALARRLAQVSAEASMAHFERCLVDIKPDGSEVTDGDRAAEAAVRATLATEAPLDFVVGEEEGGELDLEAERCWIVDPIDGTASFVLGVPLFGTLVALVERGVVTTGVIGFPALDEQVFARRGMGCWFTRRGSDPERVRASPVQSLSDAYASTTGPHFSDMLPEGSVGPRYGLRAIAGQAKRFRSVSDCLQYALLCRGRIHVAIDTQMALWDIAALMPCVEEAGGRLSGIDGSPVVLGETQSLVATTSEALHGEVIAALQERQ